MRGAERGHDIRFSWVFLTLYGVLCASGVFDFTRAVLDPDTEADFFLYRVLPRSVQPVISAVVALIVLWVLVLELRTLVLQRSAIEVNDGSLTIRANLIFKEETIAWIPNDVVPGAGGRWWLWVNSTRRVSRVFLRRSDVIGWLNKLAAPHD